MRSDPVLDNWTIVAASSLNTRRWTKIAFGYIRKRKQLLNPFVLKVVWAWHTPVAETRKQITVEKFHLLGKGIAQSIHALGCGFDNRRIEVQLLKKSPNWGSVTEKVTKFFSYSERPDRLYCLSSLLFSEYWKFSPVDKRPSCADHPPLPNADVKN
jgi:hypothetical protein